MGAIFGGGVALAFFESGVALRPAADDRRRHGRRHAVGGDPRLAAHALQRQRDPGLADARLRAPRSCCRCSCTSRGAIRRASTFRSRRCSPTHALLPNLLPEGRACNVGFLIALARRRGRVACSCSKSLPGYQMRVAGLAPAAANYAGISAKRTVWIGMLIGGACAGHRRHRRGGGTGRAAAADHSRPATASPRSSSRSSAGCIPSASSSRACSCRCSTSAARRRR